MICQTCRGRIACGNAPSVRFPAHQSRVYSPNGHSNRNGVAMPSIFSTHFKRLWSGTSTSATSTRTTKALPGGLGKDDLVHSPRHLVVLVNGLFGSRANWEVISRLLRSHLDPSDTLIHVSCVNEFRRTYQGIDVCGQRLAEEIRGVVLENASSLERISLIGHSMGGLTSRYAVGDLYDPRTSTVAGLRPCHFIALASPHLGCESDSGPAQVPLIRWSQRVPGLKRLTSALAVPFSSVFFGRSGAQFFLTDRGIRVGEQAPLLYRLAHDCPEEGRFFFSGLAAFETRTLYANRSGDHLVGWSNSSLQHPDVDPGTKYKGRGVVREDPLLWAWAPKDRIALASGISEDGGRSSACEDNQAQNGGDMRLATKEQPPLPAAETTATDFIKAALASLQRLSWRRVDVCFAGGALPLLAHQHMQVQRRWVNFEGMATAKHLVLQVVAMERLRAYRAHNFTH